MDVLTYIAVALAAHFVDDPEGSLTYKAALD